MEKRTSHAKSRRGPGANYVSYFVSIVTAAAANQRSLLEGLVLTKGRVQSIVTDAIMKNVSKGFLGFRALSTLKLVSKSSCLSTYNSCNLGVKFKDTSNKVVFPSISSINVKFTSDETTGLAINGLPNDTTVSCFMTRQWQQTVCINRHAYLW